MPATTGPTAGSAATTPTTSGTGGTSGGSGISGTGTGELAQGRTATPSTGGQPFAIPGLLIAALGLFALRLRIRVARSR